MMIAETVMGYKDGGKIPWDAILGEDVGNAKKGGDMPKEEGNMCVCAVDVRHCKNSI